MRLLFFVFILLISMQVSAQNDSIISFVPPVTLADFSPFSTIIKEETDAVVLLDSGSTLLEASESDGFFTVYHHFKRILIRKKTAFDAAQVSFSFSAEMNGNKKLNTLKAFTYNLENGRIVKIPVQDKDIYMEESKKKRQEEKFAFAEVREGSIVEFEYTIRRSTVEMADWFFQGEYPTLKSVYTVEVPDIFNFTPQFQNKNYLTDTKKSWVIKTLTSSKFEYQNTTVYRISWTSLNIPQMREEPFTSTIFNYIACVKFQLSARPVKPGISEPVSTNWNSFNEDLMNSWSFGLAVEDPGGPIKREARKIAGEKNDELQKAKAVYDWVRDHLKATHRGVVIENDKSLNDVFKAGQGSIGEINLLLTSMLRSLGMKAEPVILGTRDNGHVLMNFPLYDNYNYLICRIVIGDKTYLLDATVPYLGFGKLPLVCYNGPARIIAKNSYPVFLSPDSLFSKSSNHIIIRNTSNTDRMSLEWIKNADYYESLNLRTIFKEETQADYFKNLNSEIPLGKTLDSFSVRKLDNLDESLILFFRMDMDLGKENLIYFKPFLNTALAENPFKSIERRYPVEFPFLSEKTFELDMDVPAGYDIDELPKSEEFLLNVSDATYTYTIERDNGKIHLKTFLVFKASVFDPPKYELLKDFYTSILKKQNEMIVFKKKG